MLALLAGSRRSRSRTNSFVSQINDQDSDVHIEDSQSDDA